MRSHVCKDRTETGKKVEECRVRVYVYGVFCYYCPRDEEGDKKRVLFTLSFIIHLFQQFVKDFSFRSQFLF